MRFQQLYEEQYRKKLSFKEELCSKGSEPFGLKPFDFSVDRMRRIDRKDLKYNKISFFSAAEIMYVSTQQMMKLTAQ